MCKSMRWIPVAAIVAAVAAGGLALSRSAAQPQLAVGADLSSSASPLTAPVQGEGKQESQDIAAVRKAGEALVKAFNAGDAKAVAALWIENCEYYAADGDILRGRAAIEKEYAELFKTHPKAVIDVHVESSRMLGKHAVLQEGFVTLRLPTEKLPDVSRFSALHVREDDGWRIASVREWEPAAAELVSLKDIGWLVGEWTAKGKDGDVRTTFAWDDSKTFLQGRIAVTKDGKVVSSATHFLAKDPSQGLRGFMIDHGGAIGHSIWSRDGDRWIIEAAGTLGDRTEVTGVNILVPLDNDTFTWQAVERTIGDSLITDAPPIKVTRVKASK